MLSWFTHFLLGYSELNQFLPAPAITIDPHTGSVMTPTQIEIGVLSVVQEYRNGPSTSEVWFATWVYVRNFTATICLLPVELTEQSRDTTIVGQPLCFGAVWWYWCRSDCQPCHGTGDYFQGKQFTVQVSLIQPVCFAGPPPVSSISPNPYIYRYCSWRQLSKLDWFRPYSFNIYEFSFVGSECNNMYVCNNNNM